MVSSLSMVFIVFSMFFSIIFPITLLIVIRKKYNASVLAFFVGCGIWFVFAMVFEQIFHTVVLMSPLGGAIQGNIWLYGLYGGLAAGVFEETGRLFAMKIILKKEYDNPYNSIMYGAGHGGFEAFFILGTGMLNNLIYSVLINMGQTNILTAPLNDEQRAVVDSAIDALINTKPYMFLVGDFERISAVILHISLSVLVWTAVVNCRKLYFPLAIFIHFLVDAVTVIINGYGVSAFVLEGTVFVMSVLSAVLAWKVWKSADFKNIPNK